MDQDTKSTAAAGSLEPDCSVKLSAAAKSACIWIACSREAGLLTCAEARNRIVEIFGNEVAHELESFFSPN
jgi:hypothetical protein